MKKIGIITFHNAHNYGAMLQAYALQEKCKVMGYDAKIINYINDKIERNYKVINIRGKNPVTIMKKTYNSLRYYNKSLKRYNSFHSFMNEKMNLTKKYKEINDIDYSQFNVCISGSDQVWNPKIIGELSDAYTLNFGDINLKRISYAASIGNSTIAKEYESKYIDKLKIINKISVREEDAKQALKALINKDIDVVLDPTLLLDSTQWKEEISSCKNDIKEKYICAYVVQPDKEYIKIVNDLSIKTGLKIVHFGVKNPGYKNVLKSAYTEGPLEFVNYIRNSEYVVTTSFHATVFSILFNKKFFIIPHKQTGSRVTNLLDKLGIEKRIFYSLEEFKNVNYDFNTDWESIEKVLNSEREKSIKWLENAIER